MQVSRDVHTEMPEEGHMVGDHVHMLIKIPPKFSVAEIVGYVKRKSAIAVARQWGEGREILLVRNFGHADMQYRR